MQRWQRWSDWFALWIGRPGYTLVFIWLVSFPGAGVASLLLAWGPITFAERLGFALTLLVALATLVIAPGLVWVASQWKTSSALFSGRAQAPMRLEGPLPATEDFVAQLSSLRRRVLQNLVGIAAVFAGLGIETGIDLRTYPHNFPEFQIALSYFIALLLLIYVLATYSYERRVTMRWLRGQQP